LTTTFLRGTSSIVAPFSSENRRVTEHASAWGRDPFLSIPAKQTTHMSVAAQLATILVLIVA
jgi:hypothetical protein